MQEKDIDQAKMQVQGQLAAQYIQDVMQVRLAFIKADDSLLPCDCSDTRFLLPATVAILQKITDKCFTRCVYKPGARLDDSEKICTAKCMDRYLDAMALVSQAWAARAKQQAQMGGGGGFQ